MNLKRFLARRLRNCGVKPSDANLWATRIQFQLDSMGSEGACLYLKRVGDTLIWALTGSGSKPTWVKTRERFPIILDGISAYSADIILRVAKVARSIRLESPTKRQVRKVVSGVLNPFTGTLDGLERARSLIHRGTLVLDDVHWDPTDYPTVLRQFRKVQSTSGKTPVVSQPPLEDSLRLLRSFPEFQELPSWQLVLYPLSDQSIEYALNRVQPLPRLVGEIHASQEGGAKLRMFASPYTVIQALLSPAHNFFDGYRRQLPSDCSYDQSAGAEWAQAQLAKGLTVHSVDLSTATCRFPLDIQLSMASLLGLPSEHISALELVARGDWKVGSEIRNDFNVSILRWSVGQPLGIRPSMSMFSLAHNLLLVGIALEKGLDWRDSFRVLGDDVVINDDSIASEYMTVMSNLGVPISYDKSHSSQQFAEFAGYSITPATLLRPGQWRQVRRDNVLSLAKDLGTRLEGEVTKRWLSAQKLYLFSEGSYDPPVSSWNYWLKANSLLREADILPNFKSNAPYWYYATLDKVTLFFKERGWLLPGFHPETPSLSSIGKFLPEGHVSKDILQNTRGWDCFQFRVFSALAANSLYAENGACLPSGYFPTREEVHLWAHGIIDRANSMLYQAPSSKGERLNVLLSRILSALDQASVQES